MRAESAAGSESASRAASAPGSAAASAPPASSASPRCAAVTSTASSSSSRRTNTDPSSLYANASRASFHVTPIRSSPVSRSNSGSPPSARSSRYSAYSVPSRRVYDVFVRVAVE